MTNSGGNASPFVLSDDGAFLFSELSSDMMTAETFDYIIYFVIGLGLILAARRLYQDFTRPLPENDLEKGDYPPDA